MEETMTSTSPDHHQHIADVPKRALAMTSMTNEDYRNTYWPQLQTAIDRLLQGPPPPHHTGPVIEFEPMYSAAYKCVCQQHSEALYNDLMSHVHKHFVKVAEEMQQLDEFQLIDNYYCVIHRVMYSLDGIIPIFTYLNKVYVSTKLSSNLRTELQTLFCTDVIDPVIEKLMAMVKQTTEMTPFTIAPHVLASLIKSLHKLNQAYAQKYPQVFAGYIPGVLPAMREHELSGYISETQELQASLRQSWITSSSQGRKRCLDEEMLT
ncbi:CDK2-associated and cullin domain-containing protein 1-like isoform X2 [Homarus americanus]|uniref:CDK2-associated and cullin domain-containing protein 1-like isoform X2 n=1 Tax=Homarus americanus TaxID=6706 RepID=UPI001C43BF97|nr:CDK2-associated and cullin domain-containing protein 1-like isoform X2 [Homarus americanus]